MSAQAKARDAEIRKAEAEVGELNKELKLDLVQAGVDAAGTVDPTPVSDLVGAGISIYRGDFIGAGLSLISMIPYAGDASGKTAKGARVLKKMNALRKKIALATERINTLQKQGRETASAAARARKQTQAAKKSVDDATCVNCPTPKVNLDPSVRGQAEAARETFNRVRDGYARRLGVGSGGQVHHAIELQVIDRYPGVFHASELNDFGNMRGIGTELANRRQLHNSKIREMWDRHYRQLDQEIIQHGLQPGTLSYNNFVRRYMESARDEIDHVLGQFFTEYRSGLNWQRTNP